LWYVRCPACGHADTRVVDSREAEDGESIRRRRACDKCGERFTTRERQEFDRRKLASAIGKGASRQLTPDAIDKIIDDIEATIRQSGTSEVGSGRIGEMVLDRLAEQDPMGYLRFKIVYANLQDTDALYDELERLIRVRQQARDRRVAEQTELPIEAGVVAPARRRRR
jgi:transcriptional repressor NrdR